MKTLPSGLPDHVADDEDLARFLTQSSHFNATMAKPAAFLPSPKDRATSVSRHGGALRDELWSLGLVASGDRKLYGAAILKAGVAREASLEVHADEPPPRHALLIGWPWDESDPEEQKAKQKEIALVLASRAELIRR